MNKGPKKYGWTFQNMTEGPPRGRALRKADLFMGCEVNLSQLLPWIRERGLYWHQAPADHHQIIVWNPRVISFEGFDYLRFHHSGKAEGWNNIATPGRGLLVGHGEFVQTDATLDVGTTWFLNSWGKPNEHRRRQIVESTTLPVVQEWAKESTADVALLGGDFNNIRWDGFLPRMSQIHRKGLDRMYARTKPQKTWVWEGPVTGVGNDLRHHSLNTRLNVPKR